MQRFIALYAPPQYPTAFQEHYAQVHVPIVETMPGIRQMSYAFDVAALNGDTTYGCVFEAEFEDREALLAALGSPQGEKAAADLANFAAAGVVLLDYEVARSR